MKRILITAGPTNEYIDEVMKITNMSTGRLGIELSKEFTDHNCEVTLICTRSVARSGLYEKYHLADNQLLKTVQIETTQDMYDALEREKDNHYDLVVHASAVGDYKPEFSFKMEDMARELIAYFGKLKVGESATYDEVLSILTNPDCKVNDDTKISSYEPHLTVKLTLTTKLISHLKEWYPDSILVGFKLLENVTKEHIIEVAQKLCIKNDMNYIIANDLHDLRQGKHISYLVAKDGYQNHDFYSPQDIFNKLFTFLEVVKNNE